jgi:hypothetical protein
MRQTLLALAIVAALSACSKPTEAVEGQHAQPASARAAAPKNGGGADEAGSAAFTNAIKADFASQFVTSASESCAAVKGKEFPVPNSGSPMRYGADGVISWGKSSLDYVKEPGAALVLTNSRGDKTFSFGVDIHDLPGGERRYVAGLSQLKGAPLGATVTDETKAVNGDVNLTTGNLCGGSAVPALVTQGLWPLAVRHLQVPATVMSCTPIGKFESQDIPFAFDGKTIQAGTNGFTQADTAFSEGLVIDPKGNNAGVVYSVSRADGSGASLGLSRPGALSYAALDLPGGEHLLCMPK